MEPIAHTINIVFPNYFLMLASLQYYERWQSHFDTVYIDLHLLTL